MQDDLEDLFGGLAGAPAATRPQPFKFLDPYGPEDRAIFFGRESETALLYAQFFKSRLTLVYGESGTGKTSLIDCGLRAQIPPEDMLFIPVRTALDPETALRQELLKQVPLADGAPEELEALLREAIRRKHKTLVLVFDQFEEFLLFQPASVRTAFARQVAAWLEHGLDLRLLIGIREEYLARLTELEEYLPGLYQNRLWVRRMSRAQAQEAITGPCQALGIAIEPELVAELLDTLTSGGQGVELPILQVVLDTLYRRAVEDDPDHPRLTRAGYQALGQAQSILARFIEERVSAYGDEAEPARQVLKTLVTAEGTRRLSSPAEIQERLLQFGSEVSEEQLMRRLRRLVDDRIVREDADHHLFELRHDALAVRIWQWMTGIEQELIEVRQTLEHRLREHRQRGRLLDADVLAYLAPYESRLHLRGELAELVVKSKQQAARTRRRRQRRLIAGLAVGLLVALTLASVAVLQWQEAVVQREQALVAQREAEQQRNEADKQKNRTQEALKSAFFAMTMISTSESQKRDPSISGINFLDLWESMIRFNDMSREVGGNTVARLAGSVIEWSAIGLLRRGQGQLDQSLKAHETALRHAQEILSIDPNDVTGNVGTMLSLIGIGITAKEKGDLTAATTALDNALPTLRRLADEEHLHGNWSTALVANLIWAADIREKQGDASGAMRVYRELATLSSQIAAANQKNIVGEYALVGKALSSFMIGQLLQKQGETSGAFNAYSIPLQVVDLLFLLYLILKILLSIFSMT